MGSSLLPEQDALTVGGSVYNQLVPEGSSSQFTATHWGLDAIHRLLRTPSAPSVSSLFECGLQCLRQGYFTEGVILFALAREQLTPDQVELAAVLDTFIQGYKKYWQAQQALHQASKHFTEVDEEQQAQITALEKLLPMVMKEKGESPFVESRLQQALTYLDGDSKTLPGLYISCFGCFEVKRSGQLVVLCTNRNGQAILRYLVARTDHRATVDVLMATMWPEDEPEVAYHKLQVAVSALRCSLNRGYVTDSGRGYILCKNRVYQLNPLILFSTDVEEFLELYHAGQQSSGSAMAAHYERACKLYTGPFLPEDLYASWSFVQREQLSRAYLVMCSALAEHCIDTGRYENAIQWATAILKEDHCDEAAHRQLLQAYAAQGCRSEALRQYQRCERILAKELGVQPMSETVSLFQEILNNEKLPEDGTKIERK